MINKFKTGFTYLVKADPYWYIVQQAGQRSWEAIIFTHASPPQELAHKHADASKLALWFNEHCENCIVGGQYTASQTTDMRRDMFDILKYGRMT